MATAAAAAPSNPYSYTIDPTTGLISVSSTPTDPYASLINAIIAGGSSAANTAAANRQQSTNNQLSQEQLQTQAAIQAAQTQLAQLNFQSSQGQTALKNAAAGGLLQGAQDVTVTPPPNVAPYMGTITGGLRPSALVGAQGIGANLQQQALLQLMNPNAAAGGPMPALNTGAAATNGLLPVSSITAPGQQPLPQPGAASTIANYALPIASIIAKAYPALAGTAAKTAAASALTSGGAATPTLSGSVLSGAAGAPAAATPAQIAAAGFGDSGAGAGTAGAAADTGADTAAGLGGAAGAGIGLGAFALPLVAAKLSGLWDSPAQALAKQQAAARNGLTPAEFEAQGAAVSAGPQDTAINNTLAAYEAAHDPTNPANPNYDPNANAPGSGLSVPATDASGMTDAQRQALLAALQPNAGTPGPMPSNTTGPPS